MKLKEAITTALTYLGDEDATICSDAESFPKLALIVKCANIVIKEIASDYLPLTETETVEVKEGRISFDALSRRVAEVLSVKDADTDIPSLFSCSPTDININNSGMKRAKIKYRYVPRDVTVDDDCPLSPSVGAKTLAMGICSEFSLIDGAYERAAMFSDRFKEDMRAATRKKGEIRIKPRRWN